MADSEESLYLGSQDDSVHSNQDMEYNASVKKLIEELENSKDSEDSEGSNHSSDKMDTTVVDVDTNKREPGEKTPEHEKFQSGYITDNAA